MSTKIEWEQCLNCGDPLDAGRNWPLPDVNSGLQYCEKEECQKAKPQTIKSIKPSGRQRRKQEPDRGLAPTIKATRGYVREIPDPAKVEDFKRMLGDPQCQNERGFPRYSAIIRIYGIDSFEKGFQTIVAAAAQFPEECDEKGRPSVQSTHALKSYLKRLSKRYNGNLELYATKGVIDTGNGQYKREWRWHSNRFKKDLDHQVEEMNKLAANIQVAAKNREANFNKVPYEQRMEKVTLLDQFFDQSGA